MTQVSLTKSTPYIKLPPITRGNFSIELLKHSVNTYGFEAITFQWTYERFIHAEVMTHRWSRNYSSSRAIPYEKMVEWTRQDPALPLHLGSNKPGMQSGGIVDSPDGLNDDILDLLSMVNQRCDRIIAKHNPH